MKKVLLFGGTGNLGSEIAKEARKQGYELALVTRNNSKTGKFISLGATTVVADVTNKDSLAGICKGYDVVISSLGKSVSLNDKSKPSFYDIDYMANSNILEETKKSGVKKFVYVSAMHAEDYPDLTYFKVHHDFSEKLKASGLNYSVIKPPAIFSAFIDLIDMAKKGKLMNVGSGVKKTNPIYEGDLAKICVDSVKENNTTIEAGGKYVYTRKEINEIIQKEANPAKKVKSVPLGLIKFTLPFIKLVNRNTYDKFAFYTEVLQHDLIAPQKGEMKFEDYVKMKVKN